MEKKEAMKILKDFYDKSALFSIRTALNTVIPELKESEGICGQLIAFLKQCKAVYGDGFKQFGLNIDNALAWLEKRGHTFTKKDIDDAYLKGVCDAKRELEKQGEQKHQYKSRPRYVGEEELLGEQKSAEWSEEDKKLIDDTCHLINTLASGYGEKVTEPITFSGTQMIASIKDRLRALVDNRPQNTWKPSKGQIDAISVAVRNMKNSACYDSELVSLYNDLKKLKGE